MRKYQAETAIKSIVSSLHTLWPAALAEWDALEADHAVTLHYHNLNVGKTAPQVSSGNPGTVVRPGFNPRMQYLDDLLPEPVSLILFAREFSMHTLLTPAFYHLSRLNPTADWDLLHQNAIVRSMAFNQQLLVSGKRSARWSLLQLEDQAVLYRIIAVRDRLVEMMIKGGMGLIPRGQRLVQAMCCKRATKDIIQRIGYDALKSKDLLAEMLEHADGSYLGEAGGCDDCVQTWKEGIMRIREELWSLNVSLCGAGPCPAGYEALVSPHVF